MKKIITSLLALALLAGCSGGAKTASKTDTESKEKSLIDVTGIYYGNLSSDSDKSDAGADGMSDMIVTFTFNNDSKNREMPTNDNGEESSKVVLTLGENKYNGLSSGDYGYIPGMGFAPTLDRCSEMKNVVNYGKILGGADPVKMYARFFVNPNDLKSKKKSSIKIADDIDTSISTSKAKEIKYASETLDDKDYVRADFIYRSDIAFKNVSSLGRNKFASIFPAGDSQWGLMHDAMLNIFSDKLGTTLNAAADYGGDQNLGYSSRCFTPDRPGFNIESVKKAYPDIADNIQSLVDTTNKIGNGTMDGGYSYDTFSADVNTFTQAYTAIDNYFGIDVLSE